MNFFFSLLLEQWFSNENGCLSDIRIPWAVQRWLLLKEQRVFYLAQRREESVLLRPVRRVCTWNVHGFRQGLEWSWTWIEILRWHCEWTEERSQVENQSVKAVIVQPLFFCSYSCDFVVVELLSSLFSLLLGFCNVQVNLLEGQSFWSTVRIIIRKCSEKIFFHDLQYFDYASNVYF